MLIKPNESNSFQKKRILNHEFYNYTKKCGKKNHTYLSLLTIFVNTKSVNLYSQINYSENFLYILKINFN